MEIAFVDTFAGIGGFHLAAKAACEELGLIAKCVKAVEFNKKACETYQENLGINPFDDMTKLDPASFPEHDLLLGGFPCQPFSRNGKYYNKNNMTVAATEDRALLVHRLFEILDVKKPRFFVFENVKAIQTIKNAEGKEVAGEIDLHLKSLGYDTFVAVLDSSSFGLPQQRKRCYFVGKRKDVPWKERKDFDVPTFNFPKGEELNKSVKDILIPQVPDTFLLQHLWRNRKIGQIGKAGKKKEFSIEKGIALMREKGIGGKYLVELEKEWKKNPGTTISRLEALTIAYRCGEWSDPDRRSPDICPRAIIYGDTPSGLPRQQDKLYSIKGISPTIATFSTPCFDCPEGWRMLTPQECARLQGFPDTYILHKNKALAYKQVGNAVSVNVAKAVIKALLASAELDVGLDNASAKPQSIEAGQ